MTVSNRIKSSCEIFEITTLVAYSTCDNRSYLIDSSPHSLQPTTQSTSMTSSGHYSQAITFNDSNRTYFHIAGFVALGISNKLFSISLWLRSVSLSVVVVLHVSSTPFGYGSCLPYLGFTTNGLFTAQIYNGSTTISVISATSVVSHGVQQITFVFI